METDTQQLRAAARKFEQQNDTKNLITTYHDIATYYHKIKTPTLEIETLIEHTSHVYLIPFTSKDPIHSPHGRRPTERACPAYLRRYKCCCRSV